MSGSKALTAVAAVGGAVATHAREAPALVSLAPLLPLWVGVSLLRSGGPRPVGDEPSFLHYAHNLLHGTYATPGSGDATRFLWHGPGLPALLTPFVALHVPLPAMRLTGPLLLFLTIILFYRLLRLRLSHGWALAGAWLLGLYAPFGEIVGPLHKEPLALLLLVAALLGAARYLEHGRAGQLALAGLSLAGLAMTRLEYGWVILALLVLAGPWALLSRRLDARRALSICGLAIAGCVPWLLYTYALTGHVLYWGNSGGLSLYWMAPHDDQLGAWHGVHTVFSQAALAPFRPFFRHVETLAPLQRDLAFEHAAIAGIERNPAGYGLNLLANAARSCFAAPISSQVPAGAIAVEAAFTVPLLTGLVVCARSTWRGRAHLPREATPFCALGMLGVAAHLLPSSEPRLVLPLVPIALWLVLHTSAAALGPAPRLRAA
jgi:Dolichyl-phosphate-mannose-protein mannosyltransferase